MYHVGFVTTVASLTRKIWEDRCILGGWTENSSSRKAGKMGVIRQFPRTSRYLLQPLLLFILIPFSPNLLNQGANMSGKRPGQGVPRSRRQDDDTDGEDYPDPPHIAQSSKRRCTSGGRRTLQIQYDGSRVGISKPPMLKPLYSWILGFTITFKWQ